MIQGQTGEKAQRLSRRDTAAGKHAEQLGE